MDQNKIRLFFNSASKVCKFLGHASSHSIFDTFPTKFQISKFQTLNLSNLKFDQNCSHDGGVDTYPPQSVAILFNHTAGRRGPTVRMIEMPRFYVGKLLLHHYKSDLAHTSYGCSSVIEMYLS